MPVKPPVAELEFLKVCRNHGEFKRNLDALGLDGELVTEYAQHLGVCWYRLALEHLDDAKDALNQKRILSTYSRAYYSAYNASKAARYLVQGHASLTGDDHKVAGSGLPDDFPEVVRWSERITLLYQHRLSADYDNWTDTAAKFTITTEDAVESASEFVMTVKEYLTKKFGFEI